MNSNPQTTDDEPQIEQQARAMHDAIAQKHGLPSWDEADEEMRTMWLHTARVINEVGEDILYDD